MIAYLLHITITSQISTSNKTAMVLAVLILTAIVVIVITAIDISIIDIPTIDIPIDSSTAIDDSTMVANSTVDTSIIDILTGEIAIDDSTVVANSTIDTPIDRSTAIAIDSTLIDRSTIDISIDVSIIDIRPEIVAGYHTDLEAAVAGEQRLYAERVQSAVLVDGGGGQVDADVFGRHFGARLGLALVVAVQLVAVRLVVGALVAHHVDLDVPGAGAAAAARWVLVQYVDAAAAVATGRTVIAVVFVLTGACELRDC